MKEGKRNLTTAEFGTRRKQKKKEEEKEQGDKKG